MAKQNKTLQNPKKILIITRNFPPLTGGMEKLLLHTYLEIAKNNFCHLVGPSGCRNYTNNSPYVSEAPVSSIFSFLFVASIKAFRACIRQKPDVIIGGSGVVAPIVVMLSKLFRVKSILFIHGLDIIADNFIFQRFFVPFTAKANHLIVNSNNTKSLVESIGIAPEKIHIIHPGVELPSKKQLQPTETFRQKHNLLDAKILLSVGRLIPRKGLPEFIEYAFLDIISTNPKVKLVIIGSDPQDALSKQRSVGEEINQLILRYNLEEKIILLGKVGEDILRNAYNESDLFIFPLVDTPGDVEGFGMVAIEAASFGLPVVAFDTGGVKDAIVDGETGFLVHSGNYKEISSLIIDYFSSNPQNISHQKCIEHARKFSWHNYGKKLRQFLKTVNNAH